MRNIKTTNHGTDHHIVQRVSAILMVPLTFWLIYAMAFFANADFNEAHRFAGSIFNFIAAILFVGAVLIHSWTGMRIIIEDYIHCKKLRYFSLLFIYFLNIATFIAMTITITTSFILEKLY